MTVHTLNPNGPAYKHLPELGERETINFQRILFYDSAGGPFWAISGTAGPASAHATQPGSYGLFGDGLALSLCRGTSVSVEHNSSRDPVYASADERLTDPFTGALIVDTVSCLLCARKLEKLGFDSNGE